MEQNVSDQVRVRHTVDQSALPDKFPTHRHDAEFWESLGRAVATFGFLEEILAKAIFALTATKQYNEQELQQAYAEWLSKLEHALIDQLGNLINSLDQAVREHPLAAIDNLDTLIVDLRNASKIRNVICHGSWRVPNSQEASIPFYVNRQKEVFDTAIDPDFLSQVQKHTVDLICAVVNTVTQMGLQFPGSNGPGEVIWDKG